MYKKIILFGAIFLGLSGCSYFDAKLASNPPTQRQQICSELKRNIIFNSTSMQQVTGAASATQRAQTMHLYDKNNCGDYERK